MINLNTGKPPKSKKKYQDKLHTDLPFDKAVKKIAGAIKEEVDAEMRAKGVKKIT